MSNALAETQTQKNDNTKKYKNTDAINDWLCRHAITIDKNPCVSPDFCLNWNAFSDAIKTQTNSLEILEASDFEITDAHICLICNKNNGDYAWRISGTAPSQLTQLVSSSPKLHFAPCSFKNLIVLKNLVHQHDPNSCIFPVARGSLSKSSLGVGARFTTLHWPAVAWTMKHLSLSLTANQNSVPRELVYDVNAMLENRLASCRFPFVGCDVPEGHQGQSIEGMSQGAIITYLKHGFHKNNIPWGFNADHQPVGGHFDKRADELVQGSLFASYITFDISPELLNNSLPDSASARQNRFNETVPENTQKQILQIIAMQGHNVSPSEFRDTCLTLWPAMLKFKERDQAIQNIRKTYFTEEVSRHYFRELSIDELPGLTSNATLIIVLALCHYFELEINYIAPAFGFQKNFPFEDQTLLKERVNNAYAICDSFDVSIGFHSGSGKSAQNYQLISNICAQNLEIKTSGRYTYEMGRALAASENNQDQKLWNDWYQFTKSLALQSAFSDSEEEAKLAREFILHSSKKTVNQEEIFASPKSCELHLDNLSPDPDHMLWFEYNFLYILAANGAAQKDKLGDHSPAGYQQRERFYAISDEAKLLFAKNIVEYLIFLAENCGLSTNEKIQSCRESLASLSHYDAFLESISG